MNDVVTLALCRRTDGGQGHRQQHLAEVAAKVFGEVVGFAQGVAGRRAIARSACAEQTEVEDLVGLGGVAPDQDLRVLLGQPLAAPRQGRRNIRGPVAHLLDLQAAAVAQHPDAVLTLQRTNHVAGLPAVGIAVEVGDQDGEMARVRRPQVAVSQPVAQPAPIGFLEKHPTDHDDQQRENKF